MHYKNRREAKVGDWVVGITHNSNGQLRVGYVKELMPANSQCNVKLHVWLHAPSEYLGGYQAAVPCYKTLGEDDYAFAGNLLHVQDGYRLADIVATAWNWDSPINTAPAMQSAPSQPTPSARALDNALTILVNRAFDLGVCSGSGDPDEYAKRHAEKESAVEAVKACFPSAQEEKKAASPAENEDKARLQTLALMIWESRWVSEDTNYEKMVGIAAEIRSGNMKGIDCARAATKGGAE